MVYSVPSFWEMPSILEAVRGKGGPIDCLQGLVKALGKKDKRTKVEMLVTLVTLDYVDVKESQQFSSRDCYLSYRSPTHPSFSKLLNFLLYLGNPRMKPGVKPPAGVVSEIKTQPEPPLSPPRPPPCTHGSEPSRGLEPKRFSVCCSPLSTRELSRGVCS